MIIAILSVGHGKPWLSGEAMEILTAHNGPVPEKPLSTREFEVLSRHRFPSQKAPASGV